jgi:hypothetical protein
VVASRAPQAWLARQSVAAGAYQKAFVRWDLVWVLLLLLAGMGEAAVGARCPLAPQQRTVSKYTKGSIWRSMLLFSQTQHIPTQTHSPVCSNE